MSWTPLSRVDKDCLINDWVGCHTSVHAFILDLQREGQVSGDVWVAGVAYFLLSFVPGQCEFRCILRITVNIAAPIILFCNFIDVLSGNQFYKGKKKKNTEIHNTQPYFIIAVKTCLADE